MSASISAVVTSADLADLKTPGGRIRVDVDTAERLGAFTEDAIDHTAATAANLDIGADQHG